MPEYKTKSYTGASYAISFLVIWTSRGIRDPVEQHPVGWFSFLEENGSLTKKSSDLNLFEESN